MYNMLRQRPRNSGRFASLMELYESNYMLVRLLAPSLRALEGQRYVSSGHGGIPLELSHLEHGRYTTTFNLSYRFSSSRHGRDREPDLAIRLYHDARTCEVMSGLLPDQRFEPRRTRNLEESQRLNRFLNRWLRYCLGQNHSFDEAGELVVHAEYPVADLTA